MSDVFSPVPAGAVPAVEIADLNPTGLDRVSAAELTTRTIRHAARIYAAECLRAGHCSPPHLVGHGFNADFVLKHWSPIRLAGEDMVGAQRRDMAARDRRAVVVRSGHAR